MSELSERGFILRQANSANEKAAGHCAQRPTRAQNQLAMNDLPRCLKTCIAPVAGANHKMPSGEGKKELWRRDHTLRRWAAQAALVRSDLAGAMVLVQRAAARATCRAFAQR